MRQIGLKIGLWCLKIGGAGPSSHLAGVDNPPDSMKSWKVCKILECRWKIKITICPRNYDFVIYLNHLIIMYNTILPDKQALLFSLLLHKKKERKKVITFLGRCSASLEDSWTLVSKEVDTSHWFFQTCYHETAVAHDMYTETYFLCVVYVYLLFCLQVRLNLWSCF